MRKPCSTSGCASLAKGRGLCEVHWQREKTAGRLDDHPLKPRGLVTCGHTERKHQAKGLCASCYSTKWMRENPDKNSGNRWLKNHPEQARFHLRKHRLKKLYGLTPEQYEALWNRQGGRCANRGCSYVAPSVQPRFPLALDVDHDHASGKVRGLLCRHCNQALSRVREQRAVLAGLIRYLDRNASN